jgi:tetratricopeptide (TPR) repeat protein
MRLRGIGQWLRDCVVAPARLHEATRVVRAARREDWTRVVALIETFRRRRPSDALELGYLAAAHLRLGRYDKIVAEFQELEPACDPERLAVLRPYFASALLWLERNEEALEQFEKMNGSDPTPTHGALRYWNHAIALYRVGRLHEARDLLVERVDGYWPRPEYEQARELLRTLGVQTH